MQHHQLTDASHYNMKLFINCLLCQTQLSSFHYLICHLIFTILSHFSFWWTVSWQSFTLLPVWLQSSLSLSSFVLQNFLLPVNTSSTVDYFAAFSFFNSGFSSSKLLHTGLVHSILADQPASSTRPKTSSYVIIGHIKWTLSFCTEYSIHILFGRSSMPNKSKWGKRHIIGTAVTSAVCHDSD